METMILARNLCKSYGSFALHDVSFTVDAGEVVGLVGSNGAGKTTTLKALLGLIPIDSGEAEVLGVSLEGRGAEVVRTKEDIGVVFDTCAFPNESKVADVGLMGRLAYDRWQQSSFLKLCDGFGLAAGKCVKDLSRGMGMKLTLAFALAHDPRVLILDEATAGLDPIAREEILDILRELMLSEDRAILLSTHITTDLEKIADRIVCLDEGKVAFDVSKDSICDAAGLVRCRTSDLDALVASDVLADQGEDVRIMRHAMGVDVLVPDRFAIKEAFPELPCDRVMIEEYMTMMLKGERR